MVFAFDDDADNNAGGFYIEGEYSDNIYISSNTIYFDDYYGVYLNNADHVVIENNLFATGDAAISGR